MSKRFKLKFSRVIPSFQFCRSKKPSHLPETPGPVTHRLMLSPVNPKAVDICYPNHPAPPPSTPDYSFIKSHMSPKIASLGCGCRARSCTQYLSPDVSYESHDYLSKKETTRSHAVANSHNSKLPRKNDADKKKNKKEEVKAIASVSSRDGECFSSERLKNEEIETLISTSRSFSDDSSFDLDQSLADKSDMETKKITKKVSNGKRIVKRLGSFGSKKNRGQSKRNGSKSKRGVESSENIETPARGVESSENIETPARGSTSSKAEGKVSEIVAVVTKSQDPYEDFKRSMLEMILEKQIFEAKDLEQLLQCFLSLNSREYHEIIVEAFTEIWEALFYDHPRLKGSVESSNSRL